MIKVAGVWEHGWNVPIIEINQWELLLREFGVTHLYMIPVAGLLPYPKVNLTEKNSIKEVIEENRELTCVFVDERGETDLRDFVHPQDVLYVFGAGNKDIFMYKGEKDLSVRIPTPRNKALMFATEACAIVLYDRYLKSLKG